MGSSVAGTEVTVRSPICCSSWLPFGGRATLWLEARERSTELGLIFG